MMGALPTRETESLHALLPSLASLPEEAIVRPHTDPHAAAVTALLVADWLAQPALSRRLSEVGVKTSAPEHLARTARAIIALVDELGGDYLDDTVEIAPDIIARGALVRWSTIRELETALPFDRDVRLWLDAVRMGSGSVDLVYDLRTLADLLARYAHVIRDSLAPLPAILRAASDAIEYALRAEEPAERTLARGRLAHLWTIFVPAYEHAARAARVLSQEEGLEHAFPPLALFAARRRIQRPTDIDPSRPKPPRDTGSRRAHRAVLELEVGIASESNFYVGFTENVSAAGVFVATYMLKDIGSKLDIALKMPSGDTMRIRGTVRWQRTATPDGGWPGMGVQFEEVSRDQEAVIARFVAFREPLFYVE